MPSNSSVLTQNQRAHLRRRAQLLAAISVGYNIVEATIAIAAGKAANSIALLGFGLDSIIEASSGLIILWQFRDEIQEKREKQALRLIALSFYVLAIYVAIDSVRAIVLQQESGPSSVGIALAALSLVTMPIISRMQRLTGERLGSKAVVSDSKQTLLCSYLSAALLAGLTLNGLIGWWWADPLVGLFIAYVAFAEGREAWRGDACNC